MSGKRMRYDKRTNVERVRDSEQAARAEERAILGSKRPPKHAVKAAEAFLSKRDPWDEIKPRSNT